MVKYKYIPSLRIVQVSCFNRIQIKGYLRVLQNFMFCGKVQTPYACNISESIAGIGYKYIIFNCSSILKSSIKCVAFYYSSRLCWKIQVVYSDKYSISLIVI
jgi:hypothetical protein